MSFEFTDEEISIITECLLEAPAKISYKILDTIKTQIMAQTKKYSTEE